MPSTKTQLLFLQQRERLHEMIQFTISSYKEFTALTTVPIPDDSLSSLNQRSSLPLFSGTARPIYTHFSTFTFSSSSSWETIWDILESMVRFRISRTLEEFSSYAQFHSPGTTTRLTSLTSLLIVAACDTALMFDSERSE